MTGTVATNDRGVACRLHCRGIPGPANLSGLSEVFARRESPLILGGNTAATRAGRYSYRAAKPKEIVTFETGQFNPFDTLNKTLPNYRLRRDSEDILPKEMFGGGWAGYFSYELGRYVETLRGTVGTYPTVFYAVATERYSRCEDRDMERKKRKIRTYRDSDLWWRGIGRVEDVYKST